MAHSNRLRIQISLTVIEVILFSMAALAAYYSQKNQWPYFTALSIVATVLFAIVKVYEALPTVREILVHEDAASRIAIAAERYGVCEYFNMQGASDQELRNRQTQLEIARARAMWLCANSGASYLDPSVYRHWATVERRLREGVEFRVVLLDPFSAEKAFRNLTNSGGEHFDSKINIASLIKSLNNYPSLDVRFVKCGMHATVFATEHCVFFDPYHVGTIDDRIENRSFCLKIEPSQPKEGVGLYRLYKANFDTLWRASISFNDWMTQSADRLPAGLPQLARR